MTRLPFLTRRGSRPPVFLARGPSLVWRQTPDRKIPGERESCLLRSFPMEAAISSTRLHPVHSGLARPTATPRSESDLSRTDSGP